MDNNTKIPMSKQEYSDYVDSKAKNSPILKNMCFAFLIGGLICIIGQIFTDIFIQAGFEKKDASTISTIILIFLGAFLTSLNLYSKIGKFAGAGSIVPITGFSNSVVAPAIEFKSEGYILGLGANMFKVAGPVLVYGILSSFVIGIVYYIIQLFV
jgi:stage V sporulation protein AC